MTLEMFISSLSACSAMCYVRSGLAWNSTTADQLTA